MKKNASLALALLLCCSLYAQKPLVKFGDIPMESLTMTHYSKDSTANAVILGDYGLSDLSYSENQGLTLSFERTTRIKILKKEGFGWADFEIPLYTDGSTEEKIVWIKAQTTNLEGGKIVETKVKSESIFKDKANDNVRIVKVTFPNVKEGSVLDITYKVNSEFISNLEDWRFQYSIPVVVSEYKANIPEWFRFDKYTQGYIILTAVDQKSETASVHLAGSTTPMNYQQTRYRWKAENVPAFRTEPYITTEKDYISKINFELASLQFPSQPIKTYMGSWEDINKNYAENDNFLGEVTGNTFLKKTAGEIIAGLTTDEEKIAALNSYVKNNFTWNGAYRKFPSVSLKKLVELKKGSSAELNLLLASLLNKAGIEVHPALISTRDHGFVREHIPISTQFNGVVCLVKYGDKKMWLDATDPLLPTGVLPLRCLNGSGFVISKNGFNWMPLTTPVKSKIYATADFALDANGALAGKLNIDRVGYAAQATRSHYTSKGEEDYLKEFSAGKTWQINKKEIKNVKEVHEPLKETYEMILDAHADVSGDVIYLNPFLLMREESNPFKLETREYPVSFGSLQERAYTGKFTVPEGYVVEESPKNKVIVLPGNAAKFMYNVSSWGNQISITSILQINRDIFIQEEYPNLREFYNQVVAKQSEQIVFKKKQ